MNFYRHSASKLTSTYEKQQQPHHITNLNNFNYHTGNHHTNYNTINQSSARDILYELKQYERFASNDNRQLNQLNFNNSYISDRHHSNSFNGTNYSQNIINYNNSYYKINNINNYNCIKSQLSPRDRLDSQRHQESYQLNSSNYKNVKMERDETFVESSQLMSKKTTEPNGRPTAVRGNNVTSHTIIPPPYNNMDEDDEYHHQQQEQQQNSNTHPIYRSQHFTQVSVLVRVGNFALHIFRLSVDDDEARNFA